MISKIQNTLWPSRLKIFGCSVVLQTRCRMVVFPALARPMIRTRKRPVLVLTFCARFRCLSMSSIGCISVLERDISRWDAWDDGSNEEQDKRAGVCSVLFGYTPAKGVTSLTSCPHFTVVLPFTTLFSLIEMEFPTYTHFKDPQPSCDSLNCPRRKWKHAGLCLDLLSAPLTTRWGRE